MTEAGSVVAQDDGPERTGMLFLDIEASGLDERSYPIEIGWVAEDGSGDSILIRPARGWTYWSSKAERLHGLSRDELEQSGLLVEDAARRVADAVRDRIIYVDEPEWDRHWLGLLLGQAGLSPGYELRDTKQAPRLALAPLGTRDAGLGQNILAEARAHADRNAPRTHRAHADALNAWTMWRRVNELVAQVLEGANGPAGASE